MRDIRTYRILILDFGSQYTQLIARRVREIGVYCEIHPYNLDEATLRAFAPQGIILSGGPDSTVEESAPKAPALIFTLGIPLLGICYGMQTMAAQLGGKVTVSTHREYGYAQVRVHGSSALLEEIADHRAPDGQAVLEVWMSHGDRVIDLPEGFVSIASTEDSPIAGMAEETRKFYGLQFHPEVTHTRQGTQISARFVRDICRCEASWTPTQIIADSIEKIRNQVGQDQVLLGLSGGVDSSVVAALLHQAIGNQLICVFVDNGLLRLEEADQVMTIFAQHLVGVQIIRIEAESRFLAALSGIVDPEENVKPLAEYLWKFLRKKLKNYLMLNGLPKAPFIPMSLNQPLLRLEKLR